MKYQKKQFCIIIDGKIQANTIRESKWLCIKDFIKKDPFYSSWKLAYHLGVKCVKINISIEPGYTNVLQKLET